jgi:hypothetical protein
MKRLFMIGLAGLMTVTACRMEKSKEKSPRETGTVWTKEQAWAWQKEHGWLRGANFTPGTAINALELWQAETFDPQTIDRELGWAEGIGMNCMRVFLHHVAWEVDREGFKKRIEAYLDIAGRHGIGTIFVFFDDCWNATYQAGPQPDPKTGIHNSGWVRDPGDLLYERPELEALLETYVKDVMNTFRDDRRIVMWDLYNEPGNNNYEEKSLPLLQKAFAWGREVNPSQPLSAGIFARHLVNMNRFQLENSDIITYHEYSGPEDHQATIDSLKAYGRPLVCTEYMARKFNSLFTNIMPLLKREGVGAINWGLVDGKTNTKYAWGDPVPDGSDPPLWFHDIFRSDGTPYSQEEVDAIRSLTLNE